MATFPENAKVVIIGQGGIVGASVAHHLIERGWDNIVGIDASAIPTDVGSTAHASDFCYATVHDQMTAFTTLYSMDFYEKMGHYARVGGLEVARVGDDDRVEELKRRVTSGKAFGNRVQMISTAEAKEKFPLLEEDQIQAALWDPDAGLVIPRSQTVCAELVEAGVATGKLTPNEFVAVTSTNIAKILNCYPKKGAIMVGADADIVVLDPEKEKTITAGAQQSAIDYNVFEGFEVKAQSRYTLSRGDVIWAWGQNSQPQPGRGKFVPRPAFPSANLALSKWKELTKPKMIKRDPLNIPAGI